MVKRKGKFIENKWSISVEHQNITAGISCETKQSQFAPWQCLTTRLQPVKEMLEALRWDILSHTAYRTQDLALSYYRLFRFHRSPQKMSSNRKISSSSNFILGSKLCRLMNFPWFLRNKYSFSWKWTKFTYITITLNQRMWVLFFLAFQIDSLRISSISRCDLIIKELTTDKFFTRKQKKTAGNRDNVWLA